MKLEVLDLIAYGPFTGRRLELGAPFTIAYGPNEAGKTSALRALGDGLFGIPMQTHDAFLHPYNNLRIGMVLSSNGNRLAFVRRKGKVQTLRTVDDSAPIDDAALSGILRGLTPETFRTMFGISHEALVKGGRDVAEGQGEIGQLLFASAAGMSGLQARFRELEEEAAALFAPRASSKAINASLREIKDADAELKRCQVAIARFQENQRALVQAERDLAECDKNIEKLGREAERLGRIRTAVPTISGRKTVLAELVAFDRVPLLAVDFGTRLATATRALDAASQARAAHEAELARIGNSIAGLHVPADLLEAGEAVRKLFEQKSAIAKSKQDCSRREAELAEKKRALAEAVQRLRPGMALDEAVALDPGLLARKRIQDLAAAAPGLRAACDSAATALNTARNRLRTCEETLAGLPAVPDTAALATLVTRARRELDLPKARKLRHEAQLAEKSLGAALAALPFWTGAGEEFERLPIPTLEGIDEFRVAMQDAAGAEKDARTKRAEAEQDLAQATAERDAVIAAHDVPTAASLRDAREVRDLGWVAVKRAWRDGDPGAAEQKEFLARVGQEDLGTGYETAVREADQVADRMRDEAERVERVAALDTRIAELRRKREQAEAAVTDAESARERLQLQWQEQWLAANITPGSPAAMLGWMHRRESILQTVAARRDLGLQLETIERQEHALAEELAGLLAPHGAAGGAGVLDLLETAEGVLRDAQSVAERHRAAKTEQQVRSGEAKRLEGELAEACKNLVAWQEQWAEALAQAGIEASTAPQAAEQYLTEVREIATGLREAAQLAERIEKMHADADAFAAAVSALAVRLSPAHRHVEPEVAITHLHEALLAANEDRRLLVQEQARRRDVEEKLHAAVLEIRKREMEIESLCREAGAADILGAQKAWDDSERRRALERQRDEYDQRLLLVCAGKTIEEFVAEAGTVDPDSIASRLEEIERSATEWTTRRKEVEERRRGLDADGLAMRGSGDAAAIAQRISGMKGKMAGDIEKYIRVKAASFVLHKAIERYRERNQGPVLERAAKLFAALTCGSFAGLRLENDESATVLKGIRPGGDAVPIAAMSDGTCDQLYLALRIASLEHYFTAHQPVPFIVDDVLLNFDDGRAAAAIAALDTLSARTQVIFFTHHKHLVELARSCTNAAVLDL